jgi:hypothetical protein
MKEKGLFLLRVPRSAWTKTGSTADRYRPSFPGRDFSLDLFPSRGIRRKFDCALKFRSLKFAPTEKYYIFTAPILDLAIDFRQPAESPGGK